MQIAKCKFQIGERNDNNTEDVWIDKDSMQNEKCKVQNVRKEKLLKPPSRQERQGRLSAKCKLKEPPGKRDEEQCKMKTAKVILGTKREQHRRGSA